MSVPISRCRVCQGTNLAVVVDLGIQALTGVFPSKVDQVVPTAPLELVRCDNDDGCGLVQLRHSVDPSLLYGANYGYRSGLNASMTRHLRHRIAQIEQQRPLSDGELVIDIGSNDGTALGFYPDTLHRIGIDPTASQFADYYPNGSIIVPELYSKEVALDATGGRSAAVITSFSMFYDLEDPVRFAQSVRDVLADNGIWVFEQSYLPSMLDNVSYDTVCHEHLEYYGLTQIKWILDAIEMTIVDVEFNRINGGSFCLTAAKTPASEDWQLATSLADEAERRLRTDDPYSSFRSAVEEHRSKLITLISDRIAAGDRIAGLGASTKGNVILQYCDLTPSDITVIGEVNTNKIGCFTPGTLIPIVAEDEVLEDEYDVLLVLPWHFRSTFEQKILKGKSQLLFPLPKPELASPKTT